jgi:peptidoglycan L-alanyl-D-glutamate endopeptidase CwlK
MPSFSVSSVNKLFTCRREIVDIFTDAIKILDFSVIYGYRNKQEQDKAFAAGKSKLKWPDSKHNKTPSEAIDVCPYKDGKLQWDDREAFILLAGVVLGIAAKKGIALRWGGDWNRNFDTRDNNFDDLGHFELA